MLEKRFQWHSRSKVEEWKRIKQWEPQETLNATASSLTDKLRNCEWTKDFMKLPTDFIKFSFDSFIQSIVDSEAWVSLEFFFLPYFQGKVRLLHFNYLSITSNDLITSNEFLISLYRLPSLEGLLLLWKDDGFIWKLKNPSKEWEKRNIFK